MRIESEYWNDIRDIPKIISKLFLPGWHFIPDHPAKNQDWYERILSDSKSVIFDHNIENNVVSHSTIKIQKILTPSDWNQNLCQPKSFQVLETNQLNAYSYYDYIKAWYNTMFYQNSKNRHSWLIFFFQDKKYRFPSWFIDWFTVFGPIPAMLPENLKEGWDTFQSCFDNQNYGRYPMLLQFFSRLGLPWALYWEYKISAEGAPQALFLQRQISVKWWSNFNGADRATKFGVMKFFEKNPHFHKSMKEGQSEFLQFKSKAAAALHGIGSKQEYISSLQQMLKQLVEPESEDTGEASQEQSLEFSQNLLQSNEDDCFGIDLNQEDEPEESDEESLC